MKITAFIPIKFNNERTPGKNIKLLSDGTPLCHLIQRTLLMVPEIDEIYVFCSDERIKEYVLPGIKYLKRPEYLDTKTALCGDIMREFISRCSSDIYVLTHLTCPFTKPERFSEGIKAVISGRYDSAFACKKMQDFLWTPDGEPINFSRDRIPRTQDLALTYSETTSFYVFKKEVYEKFHARIGKTPYFCECGEIESIDIDYPEDFEIANAVYTCVQLNN